MSNLYYTHTTYPVANSSGNSAGMRGELNAIMAGFDLLPDPIGVGSKGFLAGNWQNPIITGGSIDNTPIGASARNTAKFTTLDVNGLATLSGGATLTGTLAAAGGAQATGFAISGGSIDNVPIGATTRNTMRATTLDANGLATLGAGLNLTGALNALSGQIELGAPASVGTPFIDFHSSGASSSYDARIVASGGSATDGQGTLNLKALAITLDARPTWAGGLVPWDSGNLPSPMQTTGGTFTGNVSLKSTAGSQFSPLLSLQANNGAFASVLRANNTLGLEVLNSAQSSVNLSVRDSDGFLTVRGGATLGVRPTWNGLTPWDTGNLTNLGQLTNTPGYLTVTGVINDAVYSRYLRQSGGPGGTPMVFNWSGQGGQPSWLWGGNDGVNMYVWNPSAFSVNFANSASFASAAGSVNGVSDPATRGSQVQWNSGVAEVGIGGNGSVAEMGAPWVAEGWHNIGGFGSGAQAMRFVWLRNQ